MMIDNRSCVQEVSSGADKAMARAVARVAYYAAYWPIQQVEEAYLHGGVFS